MQHARPIQRPCIVWAKTSQAGDEVSFTAGGQALVADAHNPPSPLLRKNLALCRMATEHASPGTAVEVGKLDGHQKRIPATVTTFQFYDPEKKKPRA